jgi:hypothetical protein
MRTLSLMLAAVMLFFVVPPASAGWESTKIVHVYLHMPLTAPEVPGATELYIQAFARWDDTRYLGATATVVWKGPCATCDYGLTPISIQYDVPVDLIANPQLTRAVLTFADGSRITFHATGDGHSSTTDGRFWGRFNGPNYGWPNRFHYDSLMHAAYAIGTIGGQDFDSREQPGIGLEDIAIQRESERFFRAAPAVK